MKRTSPSDRADQLQLRLPDDLRGRVKAAACLNGRSMNSVVVEALERAFPDRGEIEGFRHGLRALEDAFERNSANGIRSRLRRGVQDLLAQD